ncbi:MAG: amidohydrolase [Bacteroidales bacterium]|jgi:5-methylthioadenosine/S-adenosylhomocysteine deaminase|nr:amidohydrolase [Bacteroidales bacterium]MCI1786154.1 amidohydrolase [Bacteroidales bacterium]
MGNILLKNIVCNGQKSDIFIGEGIIKKILPAGKLETDIMKPGNENLAESMASGIEIADCSGKTAIPGFINMHTHAAMSLMRGVEEDVPDLREWLDKIWAIEAKIDEDFVYWGTKAACLEMIKTGTTTFNDQYWFAAAAKRAAEEMGIRGIISYVVLDHNDKNEAARQKEQCLKKYEESRSWNGKAVFEMAFHAIYSVSEEMIIWASEFARKRNLKLHIHLSETLKEVEDCKKAHGGLSPVEYLDRLGVLSGNLIAAHTLWLSEKDIELLGANNVNCVHNINSNTKLASGYMFKYNELRDAGANVCIGTDGCASSNNLDMLEAMKTSALIQKAWRKDPKALPIGELINLGTVNGAKALDLDTGELAEGKIADISIINTDNSFFLSPAPFLANLIYSAHSDCIDSVIASGNFVMRNRVVKGERKILDEAGKQLKKITI